MEGLVLQGGVGTAAFLTQMLCSQVYPSPQSASQVHPALCCRVVLDEGATLTEERVEQGVEAGTEGLIGAIFLHIPFSQQYPGPQSASQVQLT